LEIREVKKSLRAHMKKLREEVDLSLYRTWCNTIMEKCFSLDEWKNATIVHCYVSALNNEVDTLGLLFAMFDGGKIAAVPKCKPGLHGLMSIRISSLDELLPSRNGLMEPDYAPDREIRSERLELVLTPLVAFDRTGRRLGMGGGYYDSFLAECACPKVGLAYAFQEVEAVPTEPHDSTLDIIITEKEVIRIVNE